MPQREIVVLGGSAGGIEALERLVGGLPAALPAALFVVLHTHPTGPGYLPVILARRSPLPVDHAVDGEPIERGRVYVAPPDQHLLIEGDRVRLTRGPKENRSRPAVDPLFRSAAYFHGPAVIGVVLSGMLDDGTAGLWTIKDRGGLAIVQDPAEARFTSMPESAMRHVEVDERLAADAIGPALARLVAEPAPAPELPPAPERLATETHIAMDDTALDLSMLDLGELSPFACPECHGVLVQLKEGARVRFRCHTGHAFSAASLLSMISEGIEESLWGTMRGMEESVLLMQHMATHLAEAGDAELAGRFETRAREARERALAIRRIALRHEQVSADQLRDEAGR